MPRLSDRPGREQRAGVLGEDDRVELDPFEQPRRQHHTLAADARKRVEQHRGLPELVGRERQDVAAVDVQPSHAVD
jgi:hypothetical protein